MTHTEGDEGARESDRERDPSFPLLFDGKSRPSLLGRLLASLRRVFAIRQRRTGDRMDQEDSDSLGESSADPTMTGQVEPSSLAGSSAAVALPPRAEAGDGVRRATLQLLPGRLQPLDPAQLAQEIRFLRAGPEATVVTLGWDAAEPPSHITLDHPSIQPRHARMSYRSGQWAIESLSEWDPVLVNGTPLPPGEEPRVLWSGDEVRIGEVVFRFLMS